MEKIFKEKLNPDLIYQVVYSQLFCRKQKTAHTKDRQEVRGGGKKPWRQKGTGRARHGSIRSPLWKGGGVTFGPRKEKNLKKRIPLKMKKKAVLMILSAKEKENLIVFTEKIKAEKTKEIYKIIKDLKSVLIVLANHDIKTVKAARNIPKTGIISAKDLNALDLLQYKYVLMEEQALKIIK
ncbi:MAG: 50S ribosomal protein L4 [Candidatus Pacebacteria bacterium]|nr:50S ribosomal protein L4 [Candidatus Paceibacterota bacterium]